VPPIIRDPRRARPQRYDAYPRYQHERQPKHVEREVLVSGTIQSQ
jgi:hypothetical protein